MKIGGYKMFLDGSPQGRTAWMRTPYLPEAPDKQEKGQEMRPRGPMKQRGLLRL